MRKLNNREKRFKNKINSLERQLREMKTVNETKKEVKADTPSATFSFSQIYELLRLSSKLEENRHSDDIKEILSSTGFYLEFPEGKIGIDRSDVEVPPYAFDGIDTSKDLFVDHVLKPILKHKDENKKITTLVAGKVTLKN